MKFTEAHADLKFFRQTISEALGEPVRIFHLTFALETHLVENARRIKTTGIAEKWPVHGFNAGGRRALIGYGMVHFSLRINGTTIPAVNVLNPLCSEKQQFFKDFWAVPERFYPRVYRFLRRGPRRETIKTNPPIMRCVDQKRLWDNTIGFLQHGREALSRFSVALKRGVLLTGDPGNGKTFAARWLCAEAIAAGLQWQTVTAQDYENARTCGSTSDLFRLHEPGVILFDDFDMALRNREDVGPGVESSTFLSELDGIELHSGVVYLFTSNARLSDLDPAFRRPGRIDQVIRFPRPDDELRQRLIEERWGEEIIQAVPVADIVAATGGCSFAEVDEIKKLLVMRFLETNTWDWHWAWARFSGRTDEQSRPRSIGFSSRRTMQSMILEEDR